MKEIVFEKAEMQLLWTDHEADIFQTLNLRKSLFRHIENANKIFWHKQSENIFSIHLDRFRMNRDRIELLNDQEPNP
jgi:hypothetical protein